MIDCIVGMLLTYPFVLYSDSVDLGCCRIIKKKTPTVVCTDTTYSLQMPDGALQLVHGYRELQIQYISVINYITPLLGLHIS